MTCPVDSYTPPHLVTYQIKTINEYLNRFYSFILLPIVGRTLLIEISINIMHNLTLFDESKELSGWVVVVSVSN